MKFRLEITCPHIFVIIIIVFRNAVTKFNDRIFLILFYNINRTTLPDGGERDEAVVHRVKVRPALVRRERGRATRDRQAGQEGHDEYQIDLGGLRALAAKRPLRLSDHHGGELV